MQAQSGTLRGKHRQTEAIKRQSRGNQTSSQRIRGHHRPSEAIRGHQRPSEASEAIRGPNIFHDKAIKGNHPREPKLQHALDGKGNQGQSKAITCASPSCSTPLMATTSSSRSSIEALTNPDETSSRSSVKCHDASLKLFVRDRIPPAAPPELPPARSLRDRIPPAAPPELPPARSLPQALPVLPLRTCLDVDAPPPPPPLPPLLPLPLLLLLLLLLHPNG